MFDKEYFRVFIVIGVIGVVAIAHMATTMELGYEKTAPIYKTDNELSVSQAEGASELSVSTAQAATLEVGVPAESSQQAQASGATTANVQTPASTSQTQLSASTSQAVSSPVVNGQNGIPSTAVKSVDISTEELKKYLPKSKTSDSRVQWMRYPY